MTRNTSLKKSKRSTLSRREQIFRAAIAKEQVSLRSLVIAAWLLLKLFVFCKMELYQMLHSNINCVKSVYLCAIV